MGPKCQMNLSETLVFQGGEHLSQFLIRLVDLIPHNVRLRKMHVPFCLAGREVVITDDHWLSSVRPRHLAHGNPQMHVVMQG